MDQNIPKARREKKKNEKIGFYEWRWGWGGGGEEDYNKYKIESYKKYEEFMELTIFLL